MGRPIQTHKKVKDIDLAYIAGFLDGDGSVMVQVKKTKFNPKGWRLMSVSYTHLTLPTIYSV